ncbi:MAG: PAS domain S-box protein [Proteobacteria bacterium]|nr:PAS domain S-box protein [Pseudomonadota bacterium]MBU1638872.1 PAS domain S-box protein [Pseudomonadota bacterium]
MKIQAKLIVAFLGLSLPLLFVTNSIFYNSEKKALTHNILNHLESVASIQHHRIQDIVAQNAERLRLVTSRTQLRLSLEQFLLSGDKKHQLKMNAILDNAQQSLPDFKKISVYSPDGVRVASSGPSGVEETHPHDALVARGRVVNAVDSFYLDAGGNLALHLVGPLVLGNKFLGVLVIDATADNMVTAISDYTGLGETGETVLATRDPNGDTVFMMPTRFDRAAALSLTIPKDNKQIPINRAFTGEGALLTDAIDYRQVPVLAATRYIEDQGWGIVVKMDKAEAFAPLARMKGQFIAILVAAVCLIIVLSFYLAKSLTMPIVRLTGVAHDIAEDNFAEQAEESQTDEIGMLAAAFNKMTAKLLSTRKALERNIKTLQAANQQLLAGEERYREIYNAPSDAIFIHAADTGKILDVNEGMLEMFGYTYEEALHIDVGQISSGEPPYTMEEGGRKVQDAVLHGPQAFDWRSKKKDGTIFWTAVSLKDTEFSGQHYVIAVVRDVDDRKRAEKALAEEKEMLAVTLRSIGDGVITTDIAGNIVLLNKIAENLTGWDHEEALGKPLTEVFHIISADTRKRCENPVTKVMATGKIIGLANHTVLVAKDGSERSIADSGAPIMDQKSKIIGVVLVFRDVTEENKREEELVKGRKLESVGLLAGGIAHDFNNILAAILGNINLALLSVKPEDDAHSLLQDAEKASLRARDLTQQLLTFAKGGEPVKQLAAITDIIDDSARFVLRGSNVRCDFSSEENLWPVEIDQGQMSQVIQNIIINANQAMPEGGVVEVRCFNVSREQSQGLGLSPRDYIKVTIKDSGVGIASSLLDKIFDPYFTTKQEGSGLGLAVCHSIISKHGGSLRVTSELGVGTTFTIYLPAEKDKQLAPVAQQDVSAENDGEGRILIMDDEEMVRKISQTILSRFGYEVVLAKDGAEAVALFKEARESAAPIDLIIMDLTIPGGMGGQETVQEIHKIDPAAKVIVSSGYSNDPIMANYHDYGFVAALVKPFKLQDLQATVCRVL